MEADRTRIVWITMLALADKNGEVQASIPGLARVAGVPLEDCEAAIDKFLSPDPYSRTPDDEGRRIEKIDGGWALINHAKYRAMASRDEEKAANAERQRRHYEKRKRNGNLTQPNANLTEPNAIKTPANGSVTVPVHIADTDTEADTDNKPPLPPLQGGGATEPTEPTLPGIEAGSQTPPNQLPSDDPAKLPPDAPSPLCTPRFSAAWADWIAYRRERKLPAWKPVTIRAKLVELAGYGEPGAIESIRQSIANGYQGLFPPKSRPGSSPAPHDPLRGPDGPHADLYRRF